MTNGRKTMRDENRCALTRSGENAVEDFGFASNIELSRRLIEQNDAGAELYSAECTRKSDSLPLSAREIRAAFIATRQHGIKLRKAVCPGRPKRVEHKLVACTLWRNVVAERQLKADEVLKNGGDSRSPAVQIEIAEINTIDFDRAGLWIVEPAQQLRECRF